MKIWTVFLILGASFCGENGVYFQGCTDTRRPFLCSNAECAESYLSCSEKHFQCENLNEKKCTNGKCETSCEKVHSSSCDFRAPLRCPDGRCVALMSECTSILCPPDQPFLCPDNQCRGAITQCSYPLNILLVKQTVLTTQDKVDVTHIYSMDNKLLMSVETERRIHIKLKPKALSHLLHTRLDIGPEYDAVVFEHFGVGGELLRPSQFLRSSVVEVVTDADFKADYSNFFSIQFRYDNITSVSKKNKIPPSNLICLGLLDSSGVWACVSEVEVKTSVTYNLVTYTISKDGVYAIIFRPTLPVEQFREEVFSGVLLKNQRLSYIFAFVIFPMFLMLLFLGYKIYTQKVKEENIQTEKRYLEKKLQEIENVNIDFAGQTIFEKLDEGVQYFVNPIRNQEEENLENLKSLNIKIEKLKADKKNLAAQKRNLIYANKEKLEEIRRIRENIDKLDD